MNPRTSLVLVAIVLVLGALVYRQTQQENADVYTKAEPLLKGVDWSRVSAVRSDNLERSVHIKFERDSRGAWFITDPIAYPADESVLQNLFSYLQSNWATDIAAGEVENALAGFDPPRIALTIYETLESGSEVAHRVEIGALDIDGNRMYVRRAPDQARGNEGAIWRTARNLDTILQRHVDEFRSRRIFTLSIQELIEYRRAGIETTADGSRNLLLEAEHRGRHWTMSQPRRAQIDPQIISILLANTAAIPIEAFSAEDDSELGKFGLEAPAFTVELGDRFGNKQKALFGQARLHGPWFCKRDDLPYVWRLPEGKVFNLMMPADALYDAVFMRAFRQDIRSIELLGAETHARLSQPKQDRWTVAARAADESEWGQEFQADLRQVESILATLEQTRLDYEQSEDLALDDFPETPLRGVWVQLDDDRQGGRIGERYVTPQGSEAFTFRRDGETVIALVPPALEALLDKPARTLHSLLVLNLEENQLSRLTIGHDGVTREFQRTTKSVWQYSDLEAEATELVPFLDKIFFLRAERHLEDATGELSDVVTIDVTARTKEMNVSVAIGLDADGQVVSDVEGRRSLLRDTDLHAKLKNVVARKRRE